MLFVQRDMLTLDALRRMADRMPSEPAGDSGTPTYRRPDGTLRTREVRLPPVREETRRAAGIFGFLVVVSLLAVVPAGIFVTHAEAFLAGRFEADSILATARWLAGWTLLFIVPFAGVGLAREVVRFRQARRRLGEVATLDCSGTLTSHDGSCRVRL